MFHNRFFVQKTQQQNQWNLTIIHIKWMLLYESSINNSVDIRSYGMKISSSLFNVFVQLFTVNQFNGKLFCANGDVQTAESDHNDGPLVYSRDSVEGEQQLSLFAFLRISHLRKWILVNIFSWKWRRLKMKFEHFVFIEDEASRGEQSGSLLCWSIVIVEWVREVFFGWSR